MKTRNLRKPNGLMDYIKDHIEYFDCFPADFEDSQGRIWSYNKYIVTLTEQEYERLRKKTFLNDMDI